MKKQSQQVDTYCFFASALVGKIFFVQYLFSLVCFFLNKQTQVSVPGLFSSKTQKDEKKIPSRGLIYNRLIARISRGIGFGLPVLEQFYWLFFLLQLEKYKIPGFFFICQREIYFFLAY